MRRSAFLPLLALALALPARAQGPGPGPERGPGGPGGPGGPPMGPSPAEMLLAQTGELKLTDAQVVRLAAIARRTAERREAARASMPRPPAAADGARRQPPSDAEMQRIRQQMEQAHEQGRADLRDALAVLTPDQQATAFEHLAMRHGPGGPGGPGQMRGMRMRREGGLPGRGRERRPDGPGAGTPPPPRDGDAPRPPQP